MKLLVIAVAAACLLGGCSGGAGSLLGGSKIVCDDKGCTTTLSQYVPFAKEPVRPVKRYALEK
jgi:hypothetical protein